VATVDAMLVAMRRAIGMVRISKASNLRENETSRESQEREIRQWGEANDVEIVAILVEDGVSGFKPGTKRPKVEEAFRRIGNGEADTIVVWRLDRFLRQGSREFYKYWERLDAMGGQFAVVSGLVTFDTSTPMGVILLTLILELAKMESMARSERTSSWHDGRVGKVLPPVGPRPYGYDRKPNLLVKNDAEAKVIKDLAKMAACTNGNLAALKRYADSQGIKGTRNVALSCNGIKTMLTNEVLAGYRIIDGEWKQGEWEAILTLEQSQSLKAMFSDAARKSNYTSGKPVHFLSTLMRCHCGGRMRTKSAGAARARRRYQCRECPTSIDMEFADSTIGKAIVKKLDRKAWMALQMAGRVAAPAITARIQREQEELAAMLKAGDIKFDEWKALRLALNETLEQASTRQAVELPNVDDVAKAWPSMTTEHKRMIATAAIESLVIVPAHPELAPHDRIKLEWVA
jgi:DNA invertase Pin-like site-specific DNA recombinase